MQLTIMNWRMAIEQVPAKRMNSTQQESKVERQVRQARLLQSVENERRTSQDRLLLGGAFNRF